MVELSKIMGEEWQKLSKDQKARWNKKAVEAKTEYKLKIAQIINREKHKTAVAPSKKVATAKPARMDSSSSLSSLGIPAPAKKATGYASESDESSL
jgi:hypothetical protein